MAQLRNMPMMIEAEPREHRWIIVGEDGRHVTVGRNTDPSEEELVRASEALRANGQGAWLAIMEGSYYQPRTRVSVMMVRELTPSRGTWDEAVAAFLSMRCQKNAGPTP